MKFMINIFFKKVTIFEDKLFGFKINFPENKWKYRKAVKNTFIFLKSHTNYALILEIFNDQVYNYEILKEKINNNFTQMTVGDYYAYVVCKKFEDQPILQYEWNFIDSNNRILFTYCILDNLKETEKDNLYLEVLNILNTIKRIT